MAPPGFVKISCSGCCCCTAGVDFFLVFVLVVVVTVVDDDDDASANDCKRMVEGRAFATLVDKTSNLFSRLALIVLT